MAILNYSFFRFNNLDSLTLRKAMVALFASALFIEYQLISYHEVSTWWIPVFVFTLELIIKTSTSFIVYFMLKYDCNEGEHFIK